MAWEPKMLFDRGYDVVHGPGACSSIVDVLVGIGSRVDRDVIVGAAGGGDLLSHPDDFWYHTDGSFLAKPPRWMIIEVLQAESGGALHLLDASPLIRQFDAGEIWYGTELAGIVAPVASDINGRVCIRYRADYMRPYHDFSLLDRVHSQVARHAARSSTLVGELSQSSCLVADNWLVLHRRAAFVGKRTIRRLWLSWPPGEM